MFHTYNFPNVGTLADIAVTDSRETAIRHITKGYLPFTVPQMFGKEEGQFTLILKRQKGTPDPVSDEDALKALCVYEKASMGLHEKQHLDSLRESLAKTMMAAITDSMEALKRAATRPEEVNP